MQITITTVEFSEDDIYEGSLPMECYEGARQEVVEVDGVDEAVEVLRRHGLVFEEGCAWAVDPDGSRIVDYVTGERHEVSGHLEGFTVEQENELRALV